MSATIKEIVEAFELFYEALWDRDFRKSVKFTDYTERELLPLVRAFLLGYFGRGVSPEVTSELPSRISGWGRIDFVVDGVAVEFAVRNEGKNRQSLSDVTNADEIKKLMKWEGKALLILFDFANDSLGEQDIERYRDWPSLGQGNHKKSAFNVAYFTRSKEEKDVTIIQKNIRVS